MVKGPAELKAPGESFSEVIKELTASSKRTASSLLADAASLRFDEETLDFMEEAHADARILPLLQSRLKEKDRAIEVDVDSV